jgi:hypothetical protein
MRLTAAAALALILLAAGCSHRAPEPTAAVPSSADATAFHYVLTPPAPAPGSPAITEIALNDRTIHPGSAYVVRVMTSPNVLTVTVQAMGGSYTLLPVSPGLFSVNGEVPREVPFYLLNRSYTVTVTAETPDGHATSVPVTLRLER